MIPVFDVIPTVPSPRPTCAMPAAEDISEEGFGYFRGTWFIGRVPVSEAQSTVRYEAEIIEWLDAVASSPEDFELLASAIEDGEADSLPDTLHATAVGMGIDRYLAGPEEPGPLDGLEIGVAGLTHALSAVRCLTAASCRSHVRSDSWSDCPVVFSAAPAWRVEILAELISSEGCGLGQGRNMLTVDAASIRHAHRLAERIVAERGRFRRRPDSSSSRPRRIAPPDHTQLDLFSDSQ
jgi:hypothetical protein